MRVTRRTAGILGVTQIVSWGALYYAFSVLAPAIGRDLGLAHGLLYGAFSLSILVAGLAAAPVGMAIDRFGGRGVMALGSVACGAGLLWLAAATGPASYLGAWIVLGLGMALSLYEAAFATITRQSPHDARRTISTVTLFGGFASTIFWPLTAQLHTVLTWRETYACFALLQFALCLPLHLLLGRGNAAKEELARGEHSAGATLASALRHPAFWTLAAAFAANAAIFSAMSVHLIQVIQELGHAPALAVLLAALIGPMQVVGRLIERSGAGRLSPHTVGKLTFAGLPLALLILALFGRHAWAAGVFCVLYGLTNGVLTILRGTLPQALFGARHYGAIAGALAGPALLSKAAGPLLVAFMLVDQGVGTLLLWALAGLAAASCVFYLAAVKSSASGPACAPPLRCP